MTRKTKPFVRTLTALSALLITSSVAAEGLIGPKENLICFVAQLDPEVATDEAAIGDLTCVVLEAGWDLPPSDRDDNRLECELDRTRTVVLPASGEAFDKWTCQDRPFWPEDLDPIEYGEEISLPPYSCSMAMDGLRCTNGGEGRFNLNRGLRSLN